MLQALFLFIAVLGASAVEATEAITIVVAAGVARSMRSSLQGAALGLGILAVIVLLFGQAIAHLTPASLAVVRTVVGILLLLMGFQWVRKAILRSSGVMAMRNEAANFAKILKNQKADAPIVGFDGKSFTMSMQGVLLEGSEVIFIVFSFGADAKLTGTGILGNPWVISIAGALASCLIISAVGIAVAGPLAKVPENLLKKAVGIMLLAFGTFWAGEGTGAAWPGVGSVPPDVLMIPVLVVVFAILTQVLTVWMAKSHTDFVTKMAKVGAK